MQSNLIGSCLKGVAAACVAVLSVSGSTYGAMRNVPSDYSTLEAAIAAADDNDEIVISTGTHELAAEISIARPLTIRGATGKPEDVIVTLPDKAGCRHFTLNDAEVVLGGLTLTNGSQSVGWTSGGSVFIDTKGGTVSNCVFTGNNQNGWDALGGAVGIASAKALVTHCFFTKNLAKGGGGSSAGGNAIHMTAAGLVRNCLFVGNGDSTVTTGKGGTVLATAGTVESCTFANNENATCAGVRVDGNNVIVRNCVFCGADCPRAGSELMKIMNDPARTGLFFNCCAPVLINDSCIASDTPLADAAAGDWTPSASIVDKGLLQDWMTDATDFAGASRIAGNGPDIGCFERDPSKFSASVEPSVTAGPAPLAVTFSVTAYGAGASGITCLWDWNGDGDWDETSDGTTTHSFDAGSYSVKVRVVDKDDTKKEYVRVSPFEVASAPKTIYVDGDSTDPVAPYNDPAFAAQTLADAYAVALDGCEIVIASNTYNIDVETEVTKGVTIRSATGNPSDVILTMSDAAGHRHLALNHGEAYLSGITFTNASRNFQYKGGNGASVLISGLGGTISNCVFTGNTTKEWGSQGGAIYMGSANAHVTHCVFTGNRSVNTDPNNGGNAIGMSDGTVRNCLFVGNGERSYTPGKCGTVYMTGGTIESCTFANNADGKCAGVSVGSANATVRNCVFYGADCPNAASELAKIMNDTSKAARFFNCCAPVEINTTCVVAAEPFVDASHGDWNPAGSIVDKGVPQDWMTDATDLAGNPRISGTKPDIGCYEKDQSKFGASVEPSALSGIGPFEVTFTVTTYGIIADGITCYWDWDGDGEWDDTSDGTTNHIFEGGVHSTKVKVVDNATKQTYEPDSPFALTIVPKTVYVDADSTDPVAPYNDPAHAAQTVADAYAVVQDGCEIVIKSGTYPVDAEIEVTKGVVFRGATGNPADVILTITNNTDKVGHRHFILNHEDSRLCGLTLTGAAQRNNNREHGGSVLVRSLGGVISNCVFSGNSTLAWAAQGGAIYLNSADALVTHCAFTNNCSANTDTDNGGNAIGMALGNVRNCLFVGNGVNTRSPGKCGTVYMTGGTIENCTFANNADGKCAGVSVGSANAVVRNCIFYGADCPNATSEEMKIMNDTSKVGCFSSCCTPVEIGKACVVTDDPKFRNEVRGNYRLKADSPAVNKGVWCDWMNGATDLGGNPRKVGKLPDIGCYECLGGGFRLIVR